jgi:hypothetical protein
MSPGMIGIIIFGTKPVARKTGTGSFFCPTCQRDTPCSHHRIRQFFTLYFVPLIPLGAVGELVRCDRCGSEHAADVIMRGYQEARTSLSPWKCRQCGNTNPPEYAHCVACNSPRGPHD